MSNIFVAGLVNVETSVKVESFPVEYTPVRYLFDDIQNVVSGVGYNIVSALSTLGHQVSFASITGDDLLSELVFNQLNHQGISTQHIVKAIPKSANSVILYDPTGKRAIFTDLKNLQETHYPIEQAIPLLETSDLAVICNINFARPLLEKAKSLGKLIASDVHAISDISDPYNTDYMHYADILFMSHEQLPVSPTEWIKQLWARFDNQIIVIGMGGEGALLGIKAEQTIHHVPAVYTRPIINTIGAGDALFSAFIHGYVSTGDPFLSLQKAVVFASYKIGESGGGTGHLSSKNLDKWHVATIG